MTGRDVALVFHSYCLNPFKFFSTVLSRKYLRGVTFPLEQLYFLIVKGEWSDPYSEELWIRHFSSQYQLWNKDPWKGGVLQLQRVEFICPLCGHNVHLELDSFIDIRTKVGLSLKCPSCHGFFQARGLRARYPNESHFVTQSRRFSPIVSSPNIHSLIVTGIS